MIKYILSPTFALAKELKENKNKDSKTILIKKLNTIYLSISIVSVLMLFIFDCIFELNLCIIFWGYFLLSRNNEIFFAFFNDALDKIDNKIPSSNLTISDRLRLSFKSYLELIINFAILYYLLPVNYWKDCNIPPSIVENLYFSGVTITTLGYGDYSPTHWFPQFLTVYEVFCGFILIIVCFTIYTNEQKGKP